jgi:PIN domain nuclease of toxin-antitoxin system
VRLLLDTNALLWRLADEGLAAQARDAIADPENLVVVSAVSAWDHDDPFDRMLIAQALAEGLMIVTRDKRFDEYSVALMPA